ncbi:MAG: hypothetical protein J2P36_09650 [Ktedonobacteraceae bacterium]|nr:hypothetical protein [Ktedonobacteraceae bacterium]
MRVVRIISLIARLALMAAMVLGLLFWIAQISFLGMLYHLLVQVGLITIHQVLGITGALMLLVLALVAVLIRGVRLLGAAGMIYALIVPALGLTQSQILVGKLHWIIQAGHLLVGIGAMYLALEIEKRYLQLKLGGQSAPHRSRTALQAE